MREQEEIFSQLGVRVVVVSFEANFLARQYLEDTALPWPLLVDEQRELYHAYGMLHGSFWDIWGLKTWLAYFRELRMGNKPKESKGDVMQRGGDVLIDPQGIIRLHHVGSGPADRPEVDRIIGLIRSSS